MRRVSSRLVLPVAAAVAAYPACIAAAETPSAPTSAAYILEAPPSAAFVWFPTFPHVGENVTLVSISTDLVSPITEWGWDLTDFGVFARGGPAISTAFTTPADHGVRLRVTGADGLSSIATQTIHMSQPVQHVAIVRPFPVVRIVGRDFSYGTKIRLLAVEAPSQARISIECRGRGCPRKGVRRAVPSSRAASTWVRFRQFERLLRPGVVLKIRVAKGSDIGAYTRFTIRRGRIPSRVDSCLDPKGIKPIACPSE